QIVKQVVALKRARDPHAADAVRRQAGDVAALEHDAAGRRRELAADLVDQAGLAGTVRTDDDVTLARRDGEIDVVGDDEATEGTAQMFDNEDIHDAHGRAPPHRSFCTVPQMPPGKNITQQMKMTPMMVSQCSL